MNTAKAPIAPEDAVYQRALRLLTVQHAVAEMCNGRKVEADPQAIRDAVAQIRQIVKSINGAHAVFVGGLAIQELGYVRCTDDIDVVVDSEHHMEVMNRLISGGFEHTTECRLKSSQGTVFVDLYREGLTLKDSSMALPHPSKLGENADFSHLAGVVRLKLDRSTMQSQADVVELLKRNLKEAESVRAALPGELVLKFDELHQAARKESEV